MYLHKDDPNNDHNDALYLLSPIMWPTYYNKLNIHIICHIKLNTILQYGQILI